MRRDSRRLPRNGIAPGKCVPKAPLSERGGCARFQNATPNGSPRPFALRTGLKGDVKRLTNFTPEYRLRVGDWRGLFEVEPDKITIYRILHRLDAYRS